MQGLTITIQVRSESNCLKSEGARRMACNFETQGTWSK